MKYLLIIQARCGSSRLPNKVLKDLAGKPVIQRVVERVKKSEKIDEIIVATSIEKNNLQLIELCVRLGIRIFAGSEEDVLDRYYQAAKLIKPEYVIRITADCPVIDYHYINLLIDSTDKETDYICTNSEEFPTGLDVEMIKFSTLKQIWQDARLMSEREHVTMYIKNHSEKFKIQTISCPISNIGKKRLTLDRIEDYELLTQIYNYFKLKSLQDDFYTEDILKFLEKSPKLEKINANIDRWEGLNISLAKDMKITKDL